MAKKKTWRQKIPFLNPKKKANGPTISLGVGNHVFSVGSRTPLWINTQNLNHYANIASTNPVVYSVLSIGANFLANGRMGLKDLKTGEIITKKNLYSDDYRNNKIVQKAFNLWDRPNPLQSSWEFVLNYSFFKQTFGNAFLYGNCPMGTKMNIENVNAIWNLWPQYMNVTLTGKYFSATNIEDIIERWNFGHQRNFETEFLPQYILHRKEVSLTLNSREDAIFGMSRFKPLNKPISNIEMGYASENIILQERGARMVITPKVTDEITGAEPMDDDEKEVLENDFKDYGFLEGQKPYIVSRVPVDITVLDQDIRKLGIFESIANNAMVVAHEFGVPEILIKLYIKGSTFENQSASVKRMYDGTTIPEHNDLADDITTWLKLRDYGFEYVSSFEHVPELQADIQKKSQADNLTSMRFKEQFLGGACTMNEWRRALGQQEDPIYEFRIYELPPEQIDIILGNSPNIEAV